MVSNRPDNGNKSQGLNAGKKPSGKRCRVPDKKVRPNGAPKKANPNKPVNNDKPSSELSKTSEVDEYLEERIPAKKEKRDKPVTEKIQENLINDALIYDDEKPVFKLRDPSWQSNIPLVLFLFAIVVYGLIVLYSVSAPAGYINSKLTSSAFFVFSQLKFTLVGLALCVVVNFIPIDFFKNRLIMAGAYLVSAGLIIVTALFGAEKQGARRWLTVGGTDFQTSEVFKICLVIVLAIYRVMIMNFQKKGKLKASDPKNQYLKDAFFEFILPVGMIVFVDAIILVQPHLSCFLIVGVVTFVCFLVSGIRLRSWIIGMGFYILVLLAVVAIVFAVPSLRTKAQDKIEKNFAHVFKRVDIYTQDEDQEMTDQEKDESLQVDRAKDAIGSGGWMGTGLGNSRYKYSYVSEAHNDYIFSIYVEETGMVGGTLLILTFLLFLFMGFRIAYRAKDVFCRIIAIGYTFLIALEAMWNIGVELTVLPATGITLPFFSYGGTAQILLLSGYAMILCVARSGVVPKTKNGGN